MSSPSKFDDIPGTIIFDAQRSRQGYHLNMFFMSLAKAENRGAFKANEEAYLGRFPMTSDQRDVVRGRDWNGMLKQGGNIYYAAKLAACDGKSFQQIAAEMTGMSLDDYVGMMLGGGRTIVGNRSKAEWDRG